MLDTAIKTAHSSRDKFLEELIQFLKIPSISTLPAHKGDVIRCANWVADQLRHIGMDSVDLLPTGGHPIVYGEWLHAPGKPTMLIYGHYDVQPVEPLDEWVSPPFEPQVRGDSLHARGASDMKGQIFAVFKALECWQDDFPLNIKFLIEGEEEIASANLGAFIDNNMKKLNADFVLNCDTGFFAPDMPGIVYGIRGLASFELEIRSSQRDLHSGLFGGIVRNPVNSLCSLIAGMQDENGVILLPGFYDNVPDLEGEERSFLVKTALSDEQWLKMSTADVLFGEPEFTAQERLSHRPSLDIIGMWGGYLDEGIQNIVPATAGAKISFRTAPGQDPGDVTIQLESYLRQNMPDGMRYKLKEFGSSLGAVMDRESRHMQAAMSALRTVFQKEPMLTRLGFSIPVVGMIKEKMNLDTVLMGFALPDDGIHGPNEKLHLPNFYKGIDSYIHFLAEFVDDNVEME